MEEGKVMGIFYARFTESKIMRKTMIAVIAALFMAVPPCLLHAGDTASLRHEYKELRQEANKAGGASKLADGRHQRFLELKYMLNAGDGRSLPLKEARQLARLEILARKSGGTAKLSEEQYLQVLALRAMKGDAFSQPLSPAEAYELARLQVEARKLGGESRLPTAARERLKTLRCKVCQGKSANPFF